MSGSGAPSREERLGGDGVGGGAGRFRIGPGWAGSEGMLPRTTRCGVEAAAYQTTALLPLVLSRRYNKARRCERRFSFSSADSSPPSSLPPLLAAEKEGVRLNRWWICFSLVYISHTVG